MFKDRILSLTYVVFNVTSRRSRATRYSIDELTHSLTHSLTLEGERKHEVAPDRSSEKETKQGGGGV